MRVGLVRQVAGDEQKGAGRVAEVVAADDGHGVQAGARARDAQADGLIADGGDGREHVGVEVVAVRERAAVRVDARGHEDARRVGREHSHVGRDVDGEHEAAHPVCGQRQRGARERGRGGRDRRAAAVAEGEEVLHEAGERLRGEEVGRAGCVARVAHRAPRPGRRAAGARARSGGRAHGGRAARRRRRAASAGRASGACRVHVRATHGSAPTTVSRARC